MKQLFLIVIKKIIIPSDHKYQSLITLWESAFQIRVCIYILRKNKIFLQFYSRLLRNLSDISYVNRKVGSRHYTFIRCRSVESIKKYILNRLEKLNDDKKCMNYIQKYFEFIENRFMKYSTEFRRMKYLTNEHQYVSPQIIHKLCVAQPEHTLIISNFIQCTLWRKIVKSYQEKIVFPVFIYLSLLFI